MDLQRGFVKESRRKSCGHLFAEKKSGTRLHHNTLTIAKKELTGD